MRNEPSERRLLVELYFHYQSAREKLTEAEKSGMQPKDIDPILLPLIDSLRHIEEILIKSIERRATGWAREMIGPLLAAALEETVPADMFPAWRIYEAAGIDREVVAQDRRPSEGVARAQITSLFGDQDPIEPRDLGELAEIYRWLPVYKEPVRRHDLVAEICGGRKCDALLRTVAYRIGLALQDGDHEFAVTHSRRLEWEMEQNDKGSFAAMAGGYAAKARRRSRKSDARAYAFGRLPLWHIHQRARQYVTKAFLEKYITLRRTEEMGPDSVTERRPLVDMGPSDWNKPATA